MELFIPGAEMSKDNVDTPFLDTKFFTDLKELTSHIAQQ
jgi:hypothetical protein